MKIKHDFVTNSSSSSFIIDEKSTKKVAKEMVDIVFKEWKRYNSPSKPNFKKQILKTIKNLKDDENVLIPFTCNYETFISRNVDGLVQVETCNNHDWSDLDIIKYLSWDESFEDTEEMTFHNIENDEKISRKEFFKRLDEEWSEKYE